MEYFILLLFGLIPNRVYICIIRSESIYLNIKIYLVIIDAFKLKFPFSRNLLNSVLSKISTMKLIRLNAIDSTNDFLKDMSRNEVVENFTTPH